MEIINRKEALDLGLTKYFDGKPCKKGHICEKWTANYSCSVCHKERQKKRYKNNSEKYREKRKEYYWNDPKTAIEKTKAWSLENKERISLNAKTRYRKNPEPAKERAKKRMFANPESYRKEARDRYAALSQEKKLEIFERRRKKLQSDISYRERTYAKATEYRKTHTDLVRSHKANYSALVVNADGKITKELIELRHTQQKRRCFYCGIEYGSNFQIDHIFPLSRGGSNQPYNIAIACSDCNQRKKAKLPWVFLKMVAKDGTHYVDESHLCPIRCEAIYP